MSGATGPQAYAERRNAARLAAVQALYQMEISGRGAAAVVRELLDHPLVEEGETPPDELDGDLLRSLVEAVVANQSQVDRAISNVLAQGWKLARLDATARAILRVGATELVTQPQTPPAVVISAYVGLAHAFFEGPEPGFINAALDALAKAQGASPDASHGAQD
jgi:N utilization substance protein B